MRIRIKLSIFVVALALAGCHSVPVPADKYYRLEAIPANAAARPVLNEALYVAPVHADGAYADRAMLYASTASPNELQQYHYQSWIEPPALLLQENMRSSFEAMGIAPRVTDVSRGSDVGYLLNSRILRLEKIIGGDNDRAVVSLHFSLQKNDPLEMVLERSYSADVPITENTQRAYVLACEAGLNKIYADFSRDLAALK